MSNRPIATGREIAWLLLIDARGMKGSLTKWGITIPTTTHILPLRELDLGHPTSLIDGIIAQRHGSWSIKVDLKQRDVPNMVRQWYYWHRPRSSRCSSLLFFWIINEVSLTHSLDPSSCLVACIPRCRRMMTFSYLILSNTSLGTFKM